MSEPQESVVIRTEKLTKHYDSGMVQALRGVCVAIHRGEFVAIMGPSGSGKSTFLNMLGTLDHPTSGHVFLEGQEVSTIRRLHEVRRNKLGFVFQFHNLIPNLTLLENVQVPLYGAGLPRAERSRRARALLTRVGLADRLNHLATRVSGGERQRAALARALVNQPCLLLADEPTGNVDLSTGEQIMQLLEEIRQEHRMTLIAVTHNPEIARKADRILRLVDGRIEAQG